MIDMKQFLSAIKQISEEKGISEESVLETIEAALAAAYKRDYGKKGQIIKVHLDRQTGALAIQQVHYVVEGVDAEEYITGAVPTQVSDDRTDLLEGDSRAGETPTEDAVVRIRFNPEKHLTLAQAHETNKDAVVGDEVVTVLESKSDFGRIAAQTAKQVVIQRLREAERGVVLSEFKGREGSIVSGTVQRREGSLVFIDLGKTNGLMPPAEQMPGDNYRLGQRFRCLVLRVEETNRGPVIVLSRSHPKLVEELFRVEVPEIENNAVEVRAVAREAGSRTKIAVASREENVDPIGSLVGQKGVRVQTVIGELGGEKIDIILWSDDPKVFIANALSPAKVIQIEIQDQEAHTAVAEVAEDQFSLAIGRRGQNVRLAAKLTGWNIDVRSPKENLSLAEALADQESAPAPVVTE